MIRIKNLLITICLVYAFADHSFAQEDEGIPTVLVGLHYGAHLPGVDLAERFGMNFNLGGSISYLAQKSIFLSVNYNFLFGTDVKEDALGSLRTAEGLIVGRDMQFANIFQRERGQYVVGLAGVLIPFKPDQNRRSGLLLAAGGGLLAHKIRFVDDFDSVTQLASPYDKGYDRLTMGLAFAQHIGYLHLGKDEMLNFFVGIDLVEGFTKNQRRFNYDLASFDEDGRFDLLTGIRVGWMFPILLEEKTVYY